LQPLCAPTGCLPSQLTTRDADVILWGASANARFGTAIAAVGDLNPTTGADGHAAELLVGGNGIAMVVDVQAAAAVAAFSVATPLEDLTPPSGSTTTRFGHLVGSMEVEGVRVLWVGEELAHALHVYNNLTDALTTPDLTITWTNQAPQNVYLSAAVGVADWDHDPLATPDLAVGCAQCATTMGNVKVFRGGDLLGTNDLTGSDDISSFSGPSRTGASLAGFADGRLAIGATHFSPGGRIYVALGSSNPTNSVGVFSPYGTWEGSSQGKLGTATAVIDIDNQNGLELLGGAPEAVFGGVRRGLVSFNRNPTATTTPPLTSEWSMWGPPNGTLGSGFGSVVAVGDINGDLFDDVLIGAPKAPNYGERGAVFVILGGRANYTFVYDPNDPGAPITQYYSASQSNRSDRVTRWLTVGA
jgi:hypothetical protein